MSVIQFTSSHHLGRLCAAVLMVGAMGGLAGCGGNDSASPRASRPPSASASPVQTAVGGPVRVIVKGIRGPVDVRGNELGVVLFRTHPTTLRTSKWEALGGSNVVVDDHGSVPVQYVRRPDPNWKQAQGPFPYVLPDVVTVPPGSYELWFWLSSGWLLPSTEYQGRHAPPPRWFPDVWGGEPDIEHTSVVGTCHTTFTVLDERGATVRVWVPEFTRKTRFDFSMTCPT